MNTTITEGWPVEHAGPREILGDRHISWVRRPLIRQNDDGRWAWTCAPLFVAGEAFEDFAKLSEAGWHITIHSMGRALLVSIVEKEY